LTTAEFVFNNKIYASTKLSLFKANCGKEPRIDFEIKKVRKYAKTEEFMKKMKKMYKKAKATLKKITEENEKIYR